MKLRCQQIAEAAIQPTRVNKPIAINPSPMVCASVNPSDETYMQNCPSEEHTLFRPNSMIVRPIRTVAVPDTTIKRNQGFLVGTSSMCFAPVSLTAAT